MSQSKRIVAAVDVSDGHVRPRSEWHHRRADAAGGALAGGPLFAGERPVRDLGVCSPAGAAAYSPIRFSLAFCWSA